MTVQQFSPLLLALLISIVLGYPAIYFAKRIGLMDIPGSAAHKQHAQPTPLAGGILLMLALAAFSFFFQEWLKYEISAVLTGALIVFLFGLWDDSKGLSARPKLLGQFLAAILLIFFGVQVHFMTVFSDAGHISELTAQILNVFITLFWVIGITNAMNMIDSMDGIVAGLGVIAFAFFLGATQLAHQPVLVVWSAALLGISAGLYFWNKITGKFFLGDSGAQTIGFLLASFGIMYNPLNRSPESSWVVPIMLLSVPIFDTTLVVFSRIWRKQLVGSGRRDHTYHRLIALGFSPRISVLITHVSAFSISCLAFFTLYLPPFTAVLFFFVTVFIGLLVLIWLEKQQTLDDDVEETKSA